MKKIYLGLILLIAATALSACGGNGGGDDPAASAAITLSVSKDVALADGADAVTVRAEVKTLEGAAVADGTSVAFSASDSAGPLSTSAAATSGGIASISLNHAPITGANKQTVTVTATALGATTAREVKFINQPASADVFIGFDQAVTNLAGLKFTLNNTTGATFDNTSQNIRAINNAEGSLTIIAGNFTTASNSTAIGLGNAGVSGINTGTTPIIKATFTVSSGLPQFSVDLTAATFSAVADDAGGAVTPAVTAANLVVTVKFDTEN